MRIGSEVQENFCHEKVENDRDRISAYLDSGGAGADKSAADHIKQLILRVMPQIIKVSRSRITFEEILFYKYCLTIEFSVAT